MKKTEFEHFGSYLLRSFTKTFPNRDYSLMQSMIYLMIIAKVKGVYDKLKTNQDWVDYAISIEEEFLSRFNYKLDTFKYITDNSFHSLTNPFEHIKLKKFDFDFNLYLPKQDLLHITRYTAKYNQVIIDETEWEKTQYIADDYLGFTYQFFLSQYQQGTMQSNCSYYTSTETINRLLKTCFNDLNNIKEIYDPFCGAGRLAFADLYNKTVLCGSDIDKPAIDLANLNNWLLNSEDDFIRFEHKDFYNISTKENYIFTNIPFSRSIKIEAEILNKIEEIMNCEAVVIIPAGHLERMEKFLNNKNWIVKRRLDINEFEPFTKACCDVVHLVKEI
jgi:type I restriction-modification system DNA methylase subunit